MIGLLNCLEIAKKKNTGLFCQNQKYENTPDNIRVVALIIGVGGKNVKFCHIFCDFHGWTKIRTFS